MFGRNKNKSGSSAGSTQTLARSVKLVQLDGPAVDLAPIRDAGHVSLVKRSEKAGVSLSKRSLSGIRAEAVVLLDHSGSMSGDYENGTVQNLVERALGFALQIDADGKIPVVPFDSTVKKTVNVTVNNYTNVVNDKIYSRRTMGSTNMAAAFGAVLDEAKSATAPIFVICICDGSPDSRPATTAAVIELSRYPVFIKFLSIRPVDYLQELDDLDGSVRFIDNVDAKDVPNPAAMSDLEFSDAMVDEWDTWINEAKTAGLLTS